MPRSRSKGPIRGFSASSGLENLDPEEAKEYNHLVQDFDRQYAKHEEDIWSSHHQFGDLVRQMGRMALFGLTKAQREKQVFNASATDNKLVKEDLFIKAINDQVNVAKSALKCKAPKASSVRRSTRIRKKPNYSSPGRLLTNDRLARLKTPVRSTRSFAKNKTSLIKTKFDTNTPMAQTIRRMAKPNEMLVSLSGSPVMSLTTVKKTARKGAESSNNLAIVPLGKGKTIMVPVEDSQGQGSNLDLDDKDKERLLALRSQLDCMLSLDENAQDQFGN